MSKQENVASKEHENTEIENNSSRILARQLARPLSADEIDFVSGARRASDVDLMVAGTCSANTCVCPDCDD
jgi:hypothetical protein